MRFDSIIKESVWVEFERWGGASCHRDQFSSMAVQDSIPVGPQRSALRCINQGE